MDSRDRGGLDQKHQERLKRARKNEEGGEAAQMEQAAITNRAQERRGHRVTQLFHRSDRLTCCESRRTLYGSSLTRRPA